MLSPATFTLVGGPKDGDRYSPRHSTRFHEFSVVASPYRAQYERVGYRLVWRGYQVPDGNGGYRSELGTC